MDDLNRIKQELERQKRDRLKELAQRAELERRTDPPGTLMGFDRATGQPLVAQSGGIRPMNALSNIGTVGDVGRAAGGGFDVGNRRSAEGFRRQNVLKLCGLTGIFARKQTDRVLVDLDNYYYPGRPSESYRDQYYLLRNNQRILLFEQNVFSETNSVDPQNGFTGYSLDTRVFHKVFNYPNKTELWILHVVDKVLYGLGNAAKWLWAYGATAEVTVTQQKKAEVNEYFFEFPRDGAVTSTHSSWVTLGPVRNIYSIYGAPPYFWPSPYPIGHGRTAPFDPNEGPPFRTWALPNNGTLSQFNRYNVDGQDFYLSVEDQVRDPGILDAPLLIKNNLCFYRSDRQYYDLNGRVALKIDATIYERLGDRYVAQNANLNGDANQKNKSDHNTPAYQVVPNPTYYAVLNYPSIEVANSGLSFLDFAFYPEKTCFFDNGPLDTINIVGGGGS